MRLWHGPKVTIRVEELAGFHHVLLSISEEDQRLHEARTQYDELLSHVVILEAPAEDVSQDPKATNHDPNDGRQNRQTQ